MGNTHAMNNTIRFIMEFVLEIIDIHIY